MSDLVAITGARACTTYGEYVARELATRRGTITLSHQLIDFALHGPDGSPNKQAEPETLWSLIDGILTAGDATPEPSPDGNTSPDEKHQPPRY